MVTLKISVNFLDENGNEITKKVKETIDAYRSIKELLKKCVGEDYDNFEALEIWHTGSLLWTENDGFYTFVEDILEICENNKDWQIYDIRMKKYERMLESVDKYREQFGPIAISPRFALGQEQLFIKLSINGKSCDAKISECAVTNIGETLAENCRLKDLIDPRFGDFSMVLGRKPVGLIHKAPLQIGSEVIQFPLAVTQWGDDDVVLGKDFLAYLDVTVDFSKMELFSPKLATSPIPMFSKKPHNDIGLIYGKQAILKSEKSKINTVPPAKKEEIEPFIRKIHEKYEEELADLDWKSCRKGEDSWCSCVIM